MAYANGQIPASALKKLSVPGWMVPSAAASLERLIKAAKAAGFTITTTSSADAYRSLTQQKTVFLARYVPRYESTGDARWYNGVLYYRRPGTAPAAIPGTSNHGKGLAVDIAGTGGFNGKLYAWLAAHAGAYGFSNTEGRSVGESWHWVYNSAHDAHKSVTKRKPHAIHTIKVSKKKDWAATLWQHFLKSQGYPVVADGVFGAATLKYTKVWQKKAGLADDGVVGKRTWYRACQGVKTGDHGYRVMIAQRVLGLVGKAVDGIAGQTFTTRAVELQRWLGVTPDADFGAKTIAALEKKG